MSIRGQCEKAFDNFNHRIQLDSNYADPLHISIGQLKAAGGKYYLNRSTFDYKLGDISNARADGQMALQKGVALPNNCCKLLNL